MVTHTGDHDPYKHTICKHTHTHTIYPFVILSVSILLTKDLIFITR